jgi:hypothetical protein
MGTMVTANVKGDVILRWDRNDPESVDKARREFNAMIGGRRFTALGRAGRIRGREVPLHEFDPNMREILMVPAMAGGC